MKKQFVLWFSLPVVSDLNLVLGHNSSSARPLGRVSFNKITGKINPLESFLRRERFAGHFVTLVSNSGGVVVTGKTNRNCRLVKKVYLNGK